MDKLGRRAAMTLMDGREIEYGLLGIKADAGYTNQVGEVQLNSPAALGDLLAGDRIVAVDDTPVFDFDTLVVAVNACSAGDRVRLKVVRGDETITRTVVLAKVAVDGEVIATNRPKAWRGLRVDYTSTLNRVTFGPNGLDAAMTGVVVAEVEPGSPAALVGLKKDLVIRRVGSQTIRTPREFAQAVAKESGSVQLQTDLGTFTVK
jgi:S1-C subfamily serine protease